MQLFKQCRSVFFLSCEVQSWVDFTGSEVKRCGSCTSHYCSHIIVCNETLAPILSSGWVVRCPAKIPFACVGGGEVPLFKGKSGKTVSREWLQAPSPPPPGNISLPSDSEFYQELAFPHQWPGCLLAVCFICGWAIGVASCFFFFF